MDDTALLVLLNLAKFTPAAIGLCVLFALLRKRRKKRALIRTAIRMQMEQLQAQQQQHTVQVIPTGSAFSNQDRSMGPQRPFEEVPLLNVCAPGGMAEKSTESGSESPTEVVWEKRRVAALATPEEEP